VSADKRWRLVCYDVRDDARYRKVLKIIRGAGESVQYSVFRCRLDDLQTERLRWRLSQVMDAKDSLLIIDLCARCAKKVVTRNHVKGWEEEPETFRILGQVCDHSPQVVRPRPNHGSMAAIAGSAAEPPQTAKSSKEPGADSES
jgi:CRISPR-associated protein Cas2